MSSWDRVQRLELEINLLQARLRAAQDVAFNLQVSCEQLTEQRDLARRVAMRLEEECHALGGSVCSVCAQVLIPVPVIGEAT